MSRLWRLESRNITRARLFPWYNSQYQRNFIVNCTTDIWHRDMIHFWTNLMFSALELHSKFKLLSKNVTWLLWDIKFQTQHKSMIYNMHYYMSFCFNIILKSQNTTALLKIIKHLLSVEIVSTNACFLITFSQAASSWSFWTQLSLFIRF